MATQTKKPFSRNTILAAVFTVAAIGLSLVYWQFTRLEIIPTELPPTAVGESSIDIMVVYNDAADQMYDNNAVTRINHLIDVSNQIYADSGINLTLRLVHTQKVDYEAGYDSRTAVGHITDQSHPAFSEVAALRSQYGADLVVLMRPFADDGYCGLAWIGGFGTNGDFSAPDEKNYGFSHVSIDCSTYVLAHELGHNMGLNHSRKQDDTGGTFDFALGFGVDNDFATVMAYSSSFNANKVKLFSNPNLSCGSDNCGVDKDSDAGADAVYTLNIVAPQIASYLPVQVDVADGWGNQGRYDTDGDGIADIVLHHRSGSWNLNTMSGTTVTSVLDLALQSDPDWIAQGREDYDGDGLADILLRNVTTGEWQVSLLNKNTTKSEAKLTITGNLDWTVVGNGDFDGDGKGDVLLRNTDGRWYLYFLDGTSIKSTAQPAIPSSLDYSIASTGDFNGDGKTDVLLRMADGAWHLYLMDGGDIAANGTVSMKKSLDWQVMGSGDFDGDEVDDLLLRYKNGSWLVYQFNNFNVSTKGFLEVTDDLDWALAATGDYDGDGNTDILVRSESFGTWRLYTLDQVQVKTSGDVNLTTDLDWVPNG